MCNIYFFNNITDSQQNPLYKELKNELMNIPVELSGFDYYQTEIPQNAKVMENIQFKIMECKKKFLQRTKIINSNALFMWNEWKWR